jgi:hypothetical protein
MNICSQASARGKKCQLGAIPPADSLARYSEQSRQVRTVGRMQTSVLGLSCLMRKSHTKDSCHTAGK